jgi:dienelactone hydrolase
MKTVLHWLLPLLMGLGIPCAHAETVTLTLANKLMATAEFHEGEPDKPAVILLHGFLQTHQFPTIKRLADSLADEGYTVLASSPT